MNPIPAGAERAGRRHGERQRWLLVYNCQVMGLGNCLNLMCDDIDVEYYDPAGFRKHAGSVGERLSSFDRVLVAPQLETGLEFDFSRHPEVWRIPTIAFNAYHPDTCYLLDSGKSLKGPLGDYHSLIAYAAHRAGLGERATVALYRADTYQALGYFERWDHARATLLGAFSEHGLDIAQAFVHWSRSGPFMYSINHPRLHCVRDVARSILGRAGLEASYLDPLPHDNLANGPVYPIYPEIGTRLGAAGHYLFKLGGAYRFIRLEDFIAASFQVYREHRGATVRPEFSRLLDQAMPVVEAAR
jgi:hypothetical protein